MLDDTRKSVEQPVRQRSRHGLGFGLVAGGALGIGLSMAVAMAAGALAAGHLGGGWQGRHGFLGRDDPAATKEHWAFATDWVLSRVDATDDQKDRAKRILLDTYDELQPLLQEHRFQHEEIVEEMTKTNLDRDAFERIRKNQVDLIDRATREIAGSLLDIAEILTPEQRIELAEMARKQNRN
jgi:Spy/CpxP family protein refolding chaperone